MYSDFSIRGQFERNILLFENEIMHLDENKHCNIDFNISTQNLNRTIPLAIQLVENIQDSMKTKPFEVFPDLICPSLTIIQSILLQLESSSIISISHDKANNMAGISRESSRWILGCAHQALQHVHSFKRSTSNSTIPRFVMTQLFEMQRGAAIALGIRNEENVVRAKAEILSADDAGDGIGGVAITSARAAELLFAYKLWTQRRDRSFSLASKGKSSTPAMNESMNWLQYPPIINAVASFFWLCPGSIIVNSSFFRKHLLISSKFGYNQSPIVSFSLTTQLNNSNITTTLLQRNCDDAITWNEISGLQDNSDYMKIRLFWPPGSSEKRSSMYINSKAYENKVKVPNVALSTVWAGIRECDLLGTAFFTDDETSYDGTVKKEIQKVSPNPVLLPLSILLEATLGSVSNEEIESFFLQNRMNQILSKSLNTISLSTCEDLISEMRRHLHTSAFSEGLASISSNIDIIEDDDDIFAEYPFYSLLTEKQNGGLLSNALLKISWFASFLKSSNSSSESGIYDDNVNVPDIMPVNGAILYCKPSAETSYESLIDLRKLLNIHCLFDLQNKEGNNTQKNDMRSDSRPGINQPAIVLDIVALAKSRSKDFASCVYSALKVLGTFAGLLDLPRDDLMNETSNKVLANAILGVTTLGNIAALKLRGNLLSWSHMKNVTTIENKNNSSLTYILANIFSQYVGALCRGTTTLRALARLAHAENLDAENDFHSEKNITSAIPISNFLLRRALSTWYNIIWMMTINSLVGLWESSVAEAIEVDTPTHISKSLEKTPVATADTFVDCDLSPLELYLQLLSLAWQELSNKFEYSSSMNASTTNLKREMVILKVKDPEINALLQVFYSSRLSSSIRERIRAAVAVGEYALGALREVITPSILMSSLLVSTLESSIGVTSMKFINLHTGIVQLNTLISRKIVSSFETNTKKFPLLLQQLQSLRQDEAKLENKQNVLDFQKSCHDFVSNLYNSNIEQTNLYVNHISCKNEDTINENVLENYHVDIRSIIAAISDESIHSMRKLSLSTLLTAASTEKDFANIKCTHDVESAESCEGYQSSSSSTNIPPWHPGWLSNRVSTDTPVTTNFERQVVHVKKLALGVGKFQNSRTMILNLQTSENTVDNNDVLFEPLHEDKEKSQTDVTNDSTSKNMVDKLSPVFDTSSSPQASFLSFIPNSMRSRLSAGTAFLKSAVDTLSTVETFLHDSPAPKRASISRKIQINSATPIVKSKARSSLFNHKIENGFNISNGSNISVLSRYLEEDVTQTSLLGRKFHTDPSDLFSSYIQNTSTSIETQPTINELLSSASLAGNTLQSIASAFEVLKLGNGYLPQLRLPFTEYSVDTLQSNLTEAFTQLQIHSQYLTNNPMTENIRNDIVRELSVIPKCPVTRPFLFQRRRLISSMMMTNHDLIPRFIPHECSTWYIQGGQAMSDSFSFSHNSLPWLSLFCALRSGKCLQLTTKDSSITNDTIDLSSLASPPLIRAWRFSSDDGLILSEKQKKAVASVTHNSKNVPTSFIRGDKENILSKQVIPRHSLTAIFTQSRELALGQSLTTIL